MEKIEFEFRERFLVIHNDNVVLLLNAMPCQCKPNA